LDDRNQSSPRNIQGALLGNSAPVEGLDWKTYPERLEEAGVSWKVYHQATLNQADKKLMLANFGFNIMACFPQFYHAEPGTPLHDKAMTISPIDQFRQDALNNQLPTVSWLYPPGHASDHMPAAGAAFVASVVDAITANPKVWAKTAFILNYDENDGLFDHVAPPVPHAGTKDEFLDGLPIGGGFRVPCLIVSPWTTGGWVCSQQFDHTSVIQFVEKITGVRETNISDWRRQTFGDLTAAFRFNQTVSGPPPFPGTAKLLAEATRGAKHLPPPVVPS
jgi:phospholipase C